MMICDRIHHRGQLSVYVRMAGGKVPSIYGPSADDPWSQPVTSFSNRGYIARGEEK